MLSKIGLSTLLLASFALLTAPAAADGPHAGKHGPLLIEATALGRVVVIDPASPLFPFLDLGLNLENISDVPVTVTSIVGELEFRDGSTSQFILLDSSGDFVLDPGFGSVFFALLIVPVDAPRGGATAWVQVTYEAGGEVLTEEVEVHFAVRSL